MKTKGVIAISQRVERIPDYNEIRDCLDQAWTSYIEAMGFWPVAVSNTLEDLSGFISTIKPNGIILSGGNDPSFLDNAVNSAPSRDQTESILIDYAIANKLPLVGICRGAQMLGHYFGAKLKPVVNHIATEHPIRSSHSDFVSRVNSFHQYGFYQNEFVDCLAVTSTSDDGVIESFKHKTLPIVGLQWHPERAPYQETIHTDLGALLRRGK